MKKKAKGLKNFIKIMMSLIGAKLLYNTFTLTIWGAIKLPINIFCFIIVPVIMLLILFLALYKINHWSKNKIHIETGDGKQPVVKVNKKYVTILILSLFLVGNAIFPSTLMALFSGAENAYAFLIINIFFMFLVVYVPAFRLFGGKYSLSRDIADLTLEKYQIDGFEQDYIYRGKNATLLFDEEQRKMAIITRMNPFCIQIVDAGRISDIETCDISVTSFIIKVKFKIDNVYYVVWVYELGKQAYWYTTKEVLDSYREEMNELAEYMKNFIMRD